MTKPSTTASNGDGRDASGRFKRGNKAAKGNPFAKKTATLRAAMLKTVTAKDIAAIVETMTERAKAGDMAAAREILDRCLGRPLQADIIERIETLETLLSETKP